VIESLQSLIMSKNVLHALTRGAWLIEADYAKDNLPLVHSILQGKTVNLNPNVHEEVIEFDLAKLTIGHVGMGPALNLRPYHFDFSNVPDGSTAIVTIAGPVFKYDVECGGYGMVSYAELIKRIDNSDKFKNIIINIDSPGGQADGTQLLSQVIRNTRKRTIGLIQDGIAASAGYWIASSCDELYVSTESSMVGSIGVLIQLANWEKYYKSKKLDLVTIYADQSEDKNKEYHEALEGRTELIKKNLLNPLAQNFINAVSKNRDGKLNLDAGNPFTGKMFDAAKAIEIGLIDGIKTFDELLIDMSNNRSSSNSSVNANSQIQNSNMKISIKKSWASLVAFMGMSFGDDQDAQETELTAEQLESINTELSTIAEKTTQIESLTGLVSEREATIETLNNSIADRDATIATHTASIAERDATIATLTARVAELGAKPGAEATQTIAAKPDKVETAAAENEILSEADIELKKNREKNAALGIN
jgi:ClpP class serine protease